MWRLLHLIAIGALIGSAIYVYNIKYQTILESEQIVKIRHQIAKTNDEINVLRAEYGHLARPDRIQELSDRLLHMQPLALNQIVRPQDIPEKGAGGDSIGREIESLGASLSASPANAPASASAPTR